MTGSIKAKDREIKRGRDRAHPPSYHPAPPQAAEGKGEHERMSDG